MSSDELKANDIQKFEFFKKIITLSFVDKVFLFGSRARSDNRKKSDIDLAVLCPFATEQEWLMILDIIEEADTLLKIDCLRLDQLSLGSDLQKNIESEGILLYVKSHP